MYSVKEYISLSFIVQSPCIQFLYSKRLLTVDYVNMKIKSNTPFAKQVVTCQTTHLGQQSKGNLFMLKGRKSTICNQP